MWFPSIIQTCCGIFILLVSTAAISSEASLYPAPNPQPLEIGAEEFRDNYLSLRGLVGLHIDLSAVMNTGEEQGIIVPETLLQQVRNKIESAGLFFLTRRETLLTPGQPTMDVWPSYKDLDSAEEDNKEYEAPARCRDRLWVELRQSATLLRQPENQFRLSTWGDGEETEGCNKDRGQWMADAVLQKIDFFIADYKRAQQQLVPVVVAKTEDVPGHCSQSWVTHLNVFKTNDSTISEAVKPIFAKLANVADRCHTFKYIIETHADQRADSTYNKLLTEARARSIKEYLLSQGMKYERIKMRPLGESAPLTNGSSDADHAKNRRVIIKPVKHEEFQNAELEY